MGHTNRDDMSHLRVRVEPNNKRSDVDVGPTNLMGMYNHAIPEREDNAMWQGLWWKCTTLLQGAMYAGRWGGEKWYSNAMLRLAEREYLKKL